MKSYERREGRRNKGVVLVSLWRDTPQKQTKGKCMLTQYLVYDLQALGYATVSHTLVGYCLNVSFGCELLEYLVLHSIEKQHHSILLKLCQP